MRIAYFNINTRNSRDKVTIRGLEENGAKISILEDNSKGLKKFFNLKKAHAALGNDYDLAFVGYTGDILIPFVRLISRKKLVYNALSSFYESMIVSRNDVGFIFWKIIKYFLIDVISFHFSHIILAESEEQKKYISKKFLIKKEKILVHLTGVDDRDFYFDETVEKLPEFTVLFRGKFLPESGIETIIESAKLLEGKGVNFRIIGHGLLEEKVKEMLKRLDPKNVELMNNFLPIEKLRKNMLECNLSLGQLSNHSRIERTIPHKAFESIAMKLPYLTVKSKPLMEILDGDKTCINVEANNPEVLAEKILALKSDPLKLKSISEAAYEKYNKNFTPRELGVKLVRNLEAVFNI